MTISERSSPACMAEILQTFKGSYCAREYILSGAVAVLFAKENDWKQNMGDHQMSDHQDKHPDKRLFFAKGFRYNICGGAMCKSRKYEQIVNMPENARKSANVRIFWQIPAKVSLGSQCLCGVQEGTVEMEGARSGR